MADEDWFTVRCVFRWTQSQGTPYEERMTLWRAESLDDAIERAEREAREYARRNKVEFTGFAQAYRLAEDQSPDHGMEVFSLLRDSGLDPDAYVRTFFDTGDEHESVDEE
jgi:hypothetical protein